MILKSLILRFVIMRKDFSMRKKIVFYLNGIRKELGGDESSMMLAEYLRYEQGLTGTKIVCAEGDCGACSVLKYFPHTDGIDTKNFLPMNSCITLVAQLDGSSVITVEALKNQNELHEIQKAMVSCHGSQCGFCTPGFVMALAGMAEEKISQNKACIKAEEVKNSMTGNLCRCTGYGPIIEAALKINFSHLASLKERYYSKNQDEDLTQIFSEGVHVESEDFIFFAPKTIDDAVSFLKTHPDAIILSAGTDLGVMHNKRKKKLSKVLSLHLIPNLYKMEMNGSEIVVGARVTHSEFRHFMKDKLPEFSKYLDIFASPQIKNVGTIIGNVANASPIGDTPPALLALEAKVVINGPQGEYEIPLKDFFLGYRSTALREGEIITHIKFNLPEKNTDLKFYKNSNRKDLDISAVNFAIKAVWSDENKSKLTDITIAAGGVAAIPMRFQKTEDYLKNQIDIEGALKELHAEIRPLSDLRASSAYRHILMENFFRAFFSEVI